MSDDLVKRLRVIGCFQNGDAICTCATGMEAADRIEELEAKLAKAVAALRLARDAINGLVDSGDAFDDINATLAKLKGQDDE